MTKQGKSGRCIKCQSNGPKIIWIGAISESVRENKLNPKKKIHQYPQFSFLSLPTVWVRYTNTKNENFNHDPRFILEPANSVTLIYRHSKWKLQSWPTFHSWACWWWSPSSRAPPAAVPRRSVAGSVSPSRTPGWTLSPCSPPYHRPGSSAGSEPK